MKTYNIILANAPIQNGNRGCAALSISSIYLIDKVLSDLGVDYHLFLPDAQIKSWDFQNKVVINGKVIEVTPINYYSVISFKQRIKRAFFSLFGDIFHIRPSYDYFHNADFVLNIGQGDSFSDIYGIQRFNSINKAYELARYHNIPYCILPQTIGPFKDSIVLAKAIESVKGAALVMARDSKSKECIQKLIPGVNIDEYLDVAFYLPYNKLSLRSSGINVGLNISALLWNGGYTMDNQFDLICEYKSLIRSIIDFFLSIPNVKLHLVAHVVEPDTCIENDYEVSYKLWKEYMNERLVLAPFALDPIEIKSYIAGLDFFIGARMHATIAAFSSGVPVVPMAYSRKFNGLYEDSLSYKYVIDMKKESNLEILHDIETYYENRSKLKKEIDIQNNTTVKKRREMIENDLISFFKK